MNFLSVFHINSLALCALHSAHSKLSLQAIKAAREFQKQTKVLEIMKHRDAWTVLNGSERMLAYGQTLKAEGMLCTTLAQAKKPGATSAVLKWAKEVVRDVLGEVASNAVMEEHVHPVLLLESRNLIGPK